MKTWQRALGRIRLLGPDIPQFRQDVEFVYEHIAALERALKELQARGGEGE